MKTPLIHLHIKAILLLLILSVAPFATKAAPEDYFFTVEDSIRYPIDGHAGQGVFEAKPVFGDCLGMNVDDMAYWCQTVKRVGIVKSLVLIGDSKIAYLWPGFIRNAPNFNIILIGRPSCPPIKEPLFITTHDRPNLDHCEKLHKYAAKAIAANDTVTHVIITFSSTTFQMLMQFLYSESGLSREDSVTLKLSLFIKEITDRGKKIIFIIDTPRLTNSEKCFPPNALVAKLPQIPGCVIPISQYAEQTAGIKRILDKIQSTLPPGHVTVYDFTAELCPNNRCSVKLNNQYLYEMGDHATDVTNEIISKKILIQSGLIAKKQ